MKISKLAWSKKRKNELLNFYALEPDSNGKVVIYNPAFSWETTRDALKQINIERASRQLPPVNGKLLHIIFDMSSGLLYLPDSQSKEMMNSDSSLPIMYDAVRLKIEKLIDYIPLIEPVRGDPFQTIRVRKIGDFFSVADFVRRQVHNVAEFEENMKLPVIEANLSIMPKTSKNVFGDKAEISQTHSAFIKPGKTVQFEVSEMLNGKQRDFTIYEEQGPFILFNSSPEHHLSASDKERMLVSAYKEYAQKDAQENSPMNKNAPDIQSYKYLMYIGWSLKELSILSFANKNYDLPQMLYYGTFLFNAAKLLKSEGYPDPTSKPYYYSFGINEKFPFKFTKQNKILYDYQSQPEILSIISFDPQTSYVTIKTPLYLPSRLVQNIFKTNSEIIISEYDNTENVIKVNVPISTIQQDAGKAFQGLMMDVANKTGTPAKSLVVREQTKLDNHYERKHISDYPQATEIIKNLCQKISNKPDPEANSFPDNIAFDDLEVVLGPWNQTAGFLGGYADVKTIKRVSGGKSMFEPIPGLQIYAPVILIDNVQYPSAGDRTNIIIHEYRHHINTQLWIDSPSQEIASDSDPDSVRIQKMVNYLRSPDERIAHKAQFKYMLAIGMTREEVLSTLMMGKPELKRAAILKEYLGIMAEAEKELSAEQKDAESEERMKEQIRQQEELNDLDMTDAIMSFYEPGLPFSV